jgi:hypothetical protein
VAAVAQTVPVSAANLQDGNGLACPTGSTATCTLLWTPVLSPLGPVTVYHKPGGGMASAAPISMPVVNRAIPTWSMPDSLFTIPYGLCWRVTLITPSGSSVLGACVQPSASNSWYAAGVDDFDNWLPTIGTIPLYGNSTFNGYMGPFIFTGSGVSFNPSTFTFTFSGGGSGSVGDSDVLGQTASQSTVNLVGTVPSSGKYRVSYYADQKALCTTGSASVLFTFNWVDATASRAAATITLTLGSTQRAAGFIQGDIPIYAAGASAITYTSTVTGACATGGPASYDAHISVEAVQ